MNKSTSVEMQMNRERKSAQSEGHRKAEQSLEQRRRVRKGGVSERLKEQGAEQEAWPGSQGSRTQTGGRGYRFKGVV